MKVPQTSIKTWLLSIFRNPDTVYPVFYRYRTKIAYWSCRYHFLYLWQTRCVLSMFPGVA